MTYQTADISTQANLCCTEAQQKLFNRGYTWAVIEYPSATVVSLHKNALTANLRKKQWNNAASLRERERLA